MNKDYNEESIQNAIMKLITSKYVEKEGKKIQEDARALNKVENEELTKEDIIEFDKMCRNKIRNNETF